MYARLAMTTIGFAFLILSAQASADEPANGKIALPVFEKLLEVLRESLSFSSYDLCSAVQLRM